MKVPGGAAGEIHDILSNKAFKNLEKKKNFLKFAVHLKAGTG
jgi:hypothetical protein